MGVGLVAIDLDDTLLLNDMSVFGPHYMAELLAKVQPLCEPTAFRMALDNLRNQVNYYSDFDVGGEPLAYALMVLAREGAAAIGDLRYYADVKSEAFDTPIAAAQLGAALAAGCTMVAKPSEFTPYCGLAWGVLAEKAGIPAGVVNIVTGDAPAIGEAMTGSALVRKVTFTGSTRVGKLLAEASARTMKRFSMELGGNAPFIIFDDADLDAAVEGAMLAKYRNSGQTCICTNRFYVQKGIYDAFAAKLAEKVKALKVGSGFETGSVQGPLINNAALEKVETLVSDAASKGGKVVAGGKLHALGGTFYEPTLITDGSQAMRIAREEVFGPVAVLFPFETEAEAIEMANATEFGLAAYFYTRDLARTFRVSAGLKYGMVGVNAGIITTEVAPFGGVKDSGVGREGSKYGLDDYLDIKYVSIGGL